MSKGSGATGGIESSPARKRRRQQVRKRQEARWASKSGPVTVRKIEPEDQGEDDSTHSPPAAPS